jgi:hypothetical protein
MKKRIFGLTLALAVSACARGDSASDSAAAASSSDPVAAAAATAKALEANPAGADSILKASGHTRDSFQELMYEIAADSAKAAAYTAAKGG